MHAASPLDAIPTHIAAMAKCRKPHPFTLSQGKWRHNAATDFAPARFPATPWDWLSEGCGVYHPQPAFSQFTTDPNGYPRKTHRSPSKPRLRRPGHQSLSLSNNISSQGFRPHHQKQSLATRCLATHISVATGARRSLPRAKALILMRISIRTQSLTRPFPHPTPPCNQNCQKSAL